MRTSFWSRLVVVFFFSAFLVACAGGPGGSIQNPVSSIDMYRVKTVYAATLELAAEYRRFCWARTYAVLMADPVARPICQNRRAVVRQIQSANSKASVAIVAADRFVAQNPTISSASIISAAWIAVQTFQSAVPVIAGRA